MGVFAIFYLIFLAGMYYQNKKTEADNSKKLDDQFHEAMRDYDKEVVSGRLLLDRHFSNMSFSSEETEEMRNRIISNTGYEPSSRDVKVFLVAEKYGMMPVFIARSGMWAVGDTRAERLRSLNAARMYDKILQSKGFKRAVVAHHKNIHDMFMDRKDCRYFDDVPDDEFATYNSNTDLRVFWWDARLWITRSRVYAGGSAVFNTYNATLDYKDEAFRLHNGTFYVQEMPGKKLEIQS